MKIQKNKKIFILIIFIISLATWGANKFTSNQYELKFTDSQEKNGSFVLQSGEYKISYYSEQYGILTIEDNTGQSLKQQTYQIFLKPNTPNEITITIQNSKLRFENRGIFVSEQSLYESIELNNDLKVLENNIENLAYEPKLSFTLDNNKYVFFLVITLILIVNFLIIWSKAYLRSSIILIILTIFIGSLFYFIKNYYNFSSLEYYSTNSVTSQQNPFKYTDTTSTRIVFRSELSIDHKSREGLNYFGLKNLTPLPNNKLLLTIPLLNNKILTTSIDKVSTNSNSLIIKKNSKNFLHISGDGISKKSFDLKNKRIDYSKLMGDSFNKSVVTELSVYKWNYGFRVINLMILTTFFNLLLFIILINVFRLKEFAIAEINMSIVSIIMISVNLFNFIIKEEILVPKMPTIRLLDLLSIHDSNMQMKIFNNQTILNNLSTDFPYLDKTPNIIELNLLTLFFTILLLMYLTRIRTLNIASFVERIFIVLAIILIYFIDILKNTNMIIVLFSLFCFFIHRTQFVSQWLKLVILVFTLTLFYPGFLLLPLILINQMNLKLIIKIYTALFTLIFTFYLSLSVNVFNSQLLIDLTNSSNLVFGPFLIIALGLLLVAFRKSESYDFMKTEQVILIGIVLFISANGSVLINILSLIILITSLKIFEGHRAGVVR